MSVSLQPGDLVLFNHRPKDDPVNEKVRPALVISNADFNQRSLNIIIVPLSSNIRLNFPWQIVLSDTAPFFQSTRLRVSSAVMCNAFFACSKKEIQRILGKIPQDILHQVMMKIREILGIT
ncbi:MAG: type II toxin-antitoxin system PemK/MazF family toxin [Sedimentisphaerales bacterium]|nr:type II toxin-antitoxin system PemK/MazF family toxin [Sedimentisphaerales bacterium]